MKGAVVLGLLVAGPVGAQDLPPEPSMGCFARIYSAEHLDAHPDQFVSALVLRISKSVFEGNAFIEAALQATLADQGRARAEGMGGQVVTQFLTCFVGAGASGWTCAVDCDGGSFDITRDDGAVMEITTSYLTAGDWEGCGGIIDLAEVPGEAVTYRLYPVRPSICGDE